MVIKPCLPEHLDAILAMESEAIASMPRPDLLRHNGPEMLAACLKSPHLTLGAFLNTKEETSLSNIHNADSPSYIHYADSPSTFRNSDFISSPRNADKEEEGPLAAIGVLFVPQPGSSDDLSQYLTGAKPQHAANFKLCIVRPQYRGNHLMLRLGEALKQEAKARGFEGLCSTVSPYNPSSYRSLEALGFSLDSTFEHYTGNLLRRLYYLPL